MSDSHPRLTVQDVPVEWRLEDGDLRFGGLSSALFWTNPSLFHMLSPLVDEVGVDLFRLLVARSSSLGTDEDYQGLVARSGATLEQGFHAWGRAISAAGWGAFELPAFDRAACTATVRIRNPWELRMQGDGRLSWGCPFLQGKVIGLFNQAFARRCWADEIIDAGSAGPAVEFRVHPSDRTIDDELDRLRLVRLRARQQELKQHMAEAAQELRRKDEEVEQKERLIRALSAPIIQVWNGVLAVPLAGVLSRERAEPICEELLHRVTSMAATHVLLDLTGLSEVDEAATGQIATIVTSLRLLGAECAVVGLSPELAQAMVELGISLRGVRTYQTLAAALRQAVGLTKRAAAPRRR
ncbi:anti-sigma factor antagonist [Sorangium cellulosum]|uniref:Anti-sigma factor antagonist n=1 Tax=Sorangium cellulosum TaxID=56 RepID=A0A2L0EZ34_SORCE|nr:STAS domain-containing protein [Sorangium cellulosum]AUX44562.1 anti-sigma factor antagonist [Sorangium cellulosum]